MGGVAPSSLVYYPDDRPGIARQRRGRGFSYLAPDGTRIDDRRERARIEALAVPPAYQKVWISPHANGHLQATGRDERERKQYRYHEEWSAAQAALKYQGLAEFGASLPRLRRWIATRLAEPAGSEELALASILALLDRASMRLGHPDYTAQNGSFGATTLRRKHVSFDGAEIRLDYIAKGGRSVSKRLHGAGLNRALQRISDLPGGEMISWTDENGATRMVRSEQVNDLLRELCGETATAKTFRTWNGTHAAFRLALGAGEEDRVTIKEMAEAAAERLHNRAATARNSYIHPDVIGLAELEPKDRAARLASLDPADESELRAGEAALLAYLQS
ncbi:DNA topoisomerase IB [Aestuariibius sp. 2305UL40-4]|uniref:DNA topoisomerase IB n=1 Tax=Aestuariibius violaceus TaxID=3234132 RepID=UPI00345E56E9